MKKFTAVFVAFSILFLSSGFCAEAKNQAKEKVPSTQEWDFGQVKQGEVLKHDFILKNDTSDILEIVNVHASCGCTTSKVEKKSLLPQSSTAINVSFDTKGYLGPVSQYVYVHTDNADMQILKYTVKALVVKEKK